MVDYDPFSDAVMRDPYPVYARLRAEAPVLYLERYDAWFLSRFDDVWEATTRPEVFSAETGVSPGQVLLREPPPPPTFATLDLPRQRPYRKLLSPAYTRQRIAQLEDRVREATRALLAPLLERGRFDVHRELAEPLATRIIAELVGVELAVARAVRDALEVFLHREPGQLGTSPEGAAAMERLMARLAALVEERRARGPGDGEDHLSVWLRAEPEGRPLSVPELCGNLFLMLMTGSEVVPLAVANTVYWLWRHPDARRRVAADRSLVAHAFAESLRFDQPTNLLGRRLAADVELHGRLLRKGQGVMFLWASANRDEREFERADVFDVERRPRRSLSYGHGIHKCIGEHLGNLEGRVLLEELLAAAPGYEVDEAGVRRSYTEFVHGYHRMPIETAPA